MPRRESKAVPEGIGLIPQYVMLDGITLADFRRVSLKCGTKFVRKMDKKARKTRGFEKDGSAFSKPRAKCSAATSCH